MKIQNSMKSTLAAIAAGLVLTGSAFAAATDFPAPLPGFMSDSELAEWRSDLIVKAEAEEAAAMAARETSQVFYTGKPFVEDTGEYSFLYRNYNPEFATWSSHDPSGFPDGANNRAYMAVPTSQFDWQGLFTLSQTQATPETIQRSDGAGYAIAYDLTHMPVGSGAHSLLNGVLESLGIANINNYTYSFADSNLPGSVDIDYYYISGKDRHGNDRPTAWLKGAYSDQNASVYWVQIVRTKISSQDNWGSWLLDGFAHQHPFLNSERHHTFKDEPTIGLWEVDGQLSYGKRELYTFAVVKSQQSITIHDGFYWGGEILE